MDMIPLNTHGESYNGICALAGLFASLKYPTPHSPKEEEIRRTCGVRWKARLRPLLQNGTSNGRPCSRGDFSLLLACLPDQTGLTGLGSPSRD